MRPHNQQKRPGCSTLWLRANEQLLRLKDKPTMLSLGNGLIFKGNGTSIYNGVLRIAEAIRAKITMRVLPP